MRVIAGSARGRRLKAPPGRGTRPTADRVREAMFSSLAAQVTGALVLDLFAGTGALGIEALSRGAAWATFVERDPRAAALVAQNLRTADLADRADVVRADAATYVQGRSRRAYSIVLCDPPYDLALPRLLRLLDTLAERGGLAPDATVVIERDRRDPDLAAADAASPLLAVHRQRSYGDTALLYLRAKEHR